MHVPSLGSTLDAGFVRGWMAVAGLAAATIAAATVVVALLEQAAEIPDASAVYLLAVVIVGSVAGTGAALGTAIASFLVYDLLFTEPRFSLAVSDTSELLNLILVVIVALAIGRLVALGRERAAESERRAIESTGLFAVSRLLAIADQTETVAAAIVERLASDADLARVWIGLEGGSRERVMADTGTGPIPNAVIVTTLARTPGDEPAHWLRAHDAGPRSPRPPRTTPGGDILRIRIESGGTVFGSLWAVKAAGSGLPGPSATRLLSLAADQLALGIRRDRLRQDATSAEVARRSDALKSALLDSVSHDLRTPLASIRATAGNLADLAVPWSVDEVRRAAETIDEEAQRLDRFVRSVLDLSRIESGALRPDVEVFDLVELIERAVARLRPALGDRPISFDVERDLPLVHVDAVLLDAILANILDNVADHTPPGTAVSVRAGRGEPGRVRVTLEDAGPGVADADLELVFDKFQRVGRPEERARRGMGVGLSIVRGMAEALGGSATARRSELGGLAIDLDLPAAPEPPDDEPR
ncbi:MAG: two-component system, OmpR family, sensor histidine kinase KdpD [Chloroflexota bacterium]|nr:two-component system, OmpR family, sensor histidine kinase KdpD [Chloroflexota bacterium]